MYVIVVGSRAEPKYDVRLFDFASCFLVNSIVSTRSSQTQKQTILHARAFRDQPCFIRNDGVASNNVDTSGLYDIVILMRKFA